MNFTLEDALDAFAADRFEDAVQAFESHWTRLEADGIGPDDPTWHQERETWVRCLARLGRSDEGRTFAEHWESVAPDPATRARALIVQAERRWSDPEATATLLRRALEALQQTGRMDGRAATLARLASNRVFAADLSEAERRLAEAEALEDPALEARMRIAIGRGQIAAATGHLREAVDQFGQAADLAVELEDVDLELFCRHAELQSRDELGDRPTAELQAFAALARRRRAWGMAAFAVWARAQTLEGQGRIEHAIELVQRSVEELESRRQTHDLRFQRGNLALLCLLDDRLDDAADLFELLLSDVGPHLIRLAAHVGLLAVAAHREDLEGVRTHWESLHRLLDLSDFAHIHLTRIAEEAALELVGRTESREIGVRLLLDTWKRWALLERPDDAARIAARLAGLANVAPVPVGPFTLVRLLGRGGMGEVWEARHGDERVALKFVRGDLESNADLESELVALAQLDHPSLAWLLHTGVVSPPLAALAPHLTAGTRWLATELVDGTPLDERCGELEWEEARSILITVLDGLAHAHARGFAHLDVKPENIIVRDDGTAVLLDFGIARRLGDRSGRVSGTPVHMAPEQFRGAPPTSRTDLYALGSVAYRMMAGEPAFFGTAGAIDRAQRSGPIPHLPADALGPPGLDEWIQTCCQIRAADRFPNAVAAATALAALGRDGRHAHPVPHPLPKVTTFFLSDIDPDVAPVEEPVEDVHGKLPAEWRRPTFDRTALREAGLGLFAHRHPPFVGRDALRQELWDAARRAAATDRREVVRLVGAPGSGRTALARWLQERAAELGADVVALTPDDVRPLVILHEDSLEDSDLTIRVGPLDPAESVALVDALLPLEPSLREVIVERGRGRPRSLVGQLRRLIAEDRVVQGERGYRLRKGAAP